MIATIPRSGSTYFSIKLWQTGVLGSPMEYLNLRAMAPYFLPRFGVISERAFTLNRDEIISYWNQVKQIRTSPNGIFGYKMFMINFRDIIKTYPDILDDIQPDYIIYLTRRDLIGQAISYSRAKLSKSWFADMPNVPAVAYDYQHILQSKKEIELQCNYWEGVFAQADIQPIRVCYEDLLESEGRTIEKILAEMSIEASLASRLSIPMIRRQSDDTTRAWRVRFDKDSSKG